MDGGYWHPCPVHGTTAKANAELWASKLAANQTRDRDTDRRLAEAGRRVVRAWEHESPVDALDVLTRDVVDARRGRLITKETSGRSGGA